MKDVLIRPAASGEADALSNLAMRSKAHWGYSKEFIEACAAELRVDPKRLDDPDYSCFVAACKEAVLGYYAIQRESDMQFELDGLFVEPEQIGRGIGRQLVIHAVERVSAAGGLVLVIQGDPNATEFYLGVGARQTGSRESGSIPDRFLPVFEIDVQEFLKEML